VPYIEGAGRDVGADGSDDGGPRAAGRQSGPHQGLIWGSPVPLVSQSISALAWTDGALMLFKSDRFLKSTLAPAQLDGKGKSGLLCFCCVDRHLTAPTSCLHSCVQLDGKVGCVALAALHCCLRLCLACSLIAPSPSLRLCSWTARWAGGWRTRPW